MTLLNVTLVSALEVLEPEELREFAECLIAIADCPPDQRGRAFRAACELQEAFNVPD